MVVPNPIYRENVFTFKNLPIEESQRKWTDCCCTILTALFALALFITSFFLFTRYNYYKVNFPADDNGMTCYNDLHDRPYMFIDDPSDPTSGRYCVKHCPKVGQAVQCQTNGDAHCNTRTSSYDSKIEVNKIGAFCVPEDENLYKTMFSNPELGHKLALTNGYEMIRFALLAGALIGLLYMALMGCVPKIMVYAVFVLAALVLIAAGLYILLRPVYLFREIGWTIALAVIFFILAIVMLILLVCYKKELELAGLFLKYANDFLKHNFLVYLYIPLFLLLTLGLHVLITWQFVAFGTSKSPTFKRENIYYHSQHIGWLQVLNGIQLIWGLQFLRDACNFYSDYCLVAFVVSGNAVEWYYHEYAKSKHCCKPFIRLLCKHWGSVVAGSFMNAFFKIFNIFSDFFNVNILHLNVQCDPAGKCGKCGNIYEKLCCCNYIFQLIRTDAYAYMNLTGIAFCNSARQCEALCKYSDLVRRSHSALRMYRKACHIFVVGLAALLVYVIYDYKTNDYGNFDHFWIAAGVVFAAYSMATYFIDIHPYAAEGILISYLTEQNCQGQQYMDVCPSYIRKEVYNYKQKYLLHQDQQYQLRQDQHYDLRQDQQHQRQQQRPF